MLISIPAGYATSERRRCRAVSAAATGYLAPQERIACHYDEQEPRLPVRTERHAALGRILGKMEHVFWTRQSGG